MYKNERQSYPKQNLIFLIYFCRLNISVLLCYAIPLARQQYQMTNTFQITSQLSEIYPDIEGQLCSKHTVLLNKVQKAYRKTFPMHPPNHYVISKTLIQLAKSSQASITMALEQGTVIMYSSGEEGGELHIASNVLEEDLVLDNSGKALNSQKESPLGQCLRSMVECATQDLSLNRINGGFIYIYCQDQSLTQPAKHSLLIGLFLTIISLNDLLPQYSQEELAYKLKSNPHLIGCDIDTYFCGCSNRELLVKGEQSTKINLQRKYKLLFLSVQLLDQEFYQQSQHENYEEIIEKLRSNPLDIVSFFLSIEQLQKSSNPALYQILSKIKQQLKIKSFILCQKYAIFLAETYRYAELIAKISKSIHKKISENAQDDGGLSQRFSSQVNINSIVFSSVPSNPLAVFDPSSSLWF